MKTNKTESVKSAANKNSTESSFGINSFADALNLIKLGNTALRDYMEESKAKPAPEHKVPDEPYEWDEDADPLTNMYLRFLHEHPEEVPMHVTAEEKEQRAKEEEDEFEELFEELFDPDSVFENLEEFEDRIATGYLQDSDTIAETLGMSQESLTSRVAAKKALTVFKAAAVMDPDKVFETISEFVGEDLADYITGNLGKAKIAINLCKEVLSSDVRFKHYAGLIEGFMDGIDSAIKSALSDNLSKSELQETMLLDIIDKIENEHFSDFVVLYDSIRAKYKAVADKAKDAASSVADFFKSKKKKDTTVPTVEAEIVPAHEKSPKKSSKQKSKADEPVVVAEQVSGFEVPAAKAQFHIPDEDEAPKFMDPSYVIVKEIPKKPDFVINTKSAAAEETGVVQDTDKDPEPVEATLDMLDGDDKIFFTRYTWALDIINCAARNKLHCRVIPLNDKADNIKALEFIVSNNFGGDPIPNKSFTVDLGNIIDREYAIWPNFSANGMIPFEDCNKAYRVFVRSSTNANSRNRTLNLEFLNKLFEVGFDGLNEKDRYGNSLYSETKIKTNRHIAMITIPKVKNPKTKTFDKDKTHQYTSAIIKLARELAKDDDLKDIRFVVEAYDPATLSFDMTSEGVVKYFMSDKKQQAFELKATPRLDDEGNPIKDDRGGLVYTVNVKPVV